MHSVGIATAVFFALIAATSASNCKPVLCAIHCSLGFNTDQNGCPICSCRRPAPLCRPVTCELACPFGLDVDQRQCPMCKCRRSPSTCIDPIFGYGCGIFDHHECPSSHQCHLRSEGEGLCCRKPDLSTNTAPSTPITTRTSTGRVLN
jgi:hypothetical protein